MALLQLSLIHTDPLIEQSAESIQTDLPTDLPLSPSLLSLTAPKPPADIFARSAEEIEDEPVAVPVAAVAL